MGTDRAGDGPACAPPTRAAASWCRAAPKPPSRWSAGRCLETYSQPLEFELDVTVPLSTFNKMLGAAAVEEDDNEDGNELTKEDIAALFGEHHLDVDELCARQLC